MFVDYTHPLRVPPLFIPQDRRSASFYLRLDELQEGHPFYALDWALFRYPTWLEAGSAWVQAQAIAEDLEQVAREQELPVEQVYPVVGSGDPAFDEALAQCLILLGCRPKVAEVTPRTEVQ